MLKFLLAAVQIVCTLGSPNAAYNAYSDQRPSADAMQLAGQVNGVLVSACRPHCPTIAMFRNPTAPNAVLIIEDSSRAKIVYKPEFFTTVYEAFGDGGILALMAHEVGHAIDVTSPAPWMMGKWNPELRADAWAACAMAKMNLNPSGLRAGLTALSKYPSPAHPEWGLRLQLLRLGYTQCGGNASQFDLVIRK